MRSNVADSGKWLISAAPELYFNFGPDRIGPYSRGEDDDAGKFDLWRQWEEKSQGGLVSDVSST